MRYPAAPWRLTGRSVQALHLLDASVAQRSVPDDVRVVTVWPGKTLAVLYCASYESPSVLCYHELVLAPALVAGDGRIGFWISQIYVDDPASQAGGHEIWGLPKELATFDWAPHGREVTVHSGAQPLCRIRWSAAGLSLPMPLYLPAISREGKRLRSFGACGSASVARTRGEISIPSGSPLTRVGFEQSRTLLLSRRLRLQVRAPRPRPLA